MIVKSVEEYVVKYFMEIKNIKIIGSIDNKKNGE